MKQLWFEYHYSLEREIGRGKVLYPHPMLSLVLVPYRPITLDVATDRRCPIYRHRIWKMVY